MTLRLISFGLLFCLLFILSCSVRDYSGYTLLPVEKRKYFIPFSIDSINSKLSYTPSDFYVQELYANDVKLLSKASKYTWVVIWAPWCTGTKELAQAYINYQKALSAKDIRLVFVALGYGPDGIRNVLHELNYQNPTYVIPYAPNNDSNKIFRAEINNKFKYRNANHYFFEKDRGLIYTEKDAVMSFKRLQKIIN